MEADDDMIVVIVADGENDEFPATVKEEELHDDDVEKLIETAATHGEMLDVYIKEELEDEDDLDYSVDGDDEYVPEGDDDDEDDYYEDDDDGGGNVNYNRQRHKMLKLTQQKSFVKELRDQYPELEDDSNALITTLSEIMRNVKPPPPPRDYFIMNGIMFECVVCGTISETQPAAGRHYQEKHGERYLICFACGVDFRSTTNLYKHEKRCMAPDAVVVLKARARVLGRKGRSRPYIPKHFDSDRSKKPSERRYPCSRCPAAFVSKTYLRSHEMLHRGVRPYMCSVCPCAYTSLAALSRHRKKHSDEQYICDHCGRAFKIKAALVTHMDTHLPIKKFGCERCTKRYATKAALVRHVQSLHLKLPPPCVCKICFKRYPLMSVLKEHTKKAHGLLLMTRRMFFKSLPTLTDTQIEQAKVVLKSELEPDYSYTLQPLSISTKQEPIEVPVEFCNKSDELPYQVPDESNSELPDESADQLPEDSSDRTPNDSSDQMPEVTDQWHLTGDIKEEHTEENNNSEERIVLSIGENCNVVLIQDGEVLNLNYDQVPQELLSNGQFVVQNGEYLLQSET